MKFPAIDDMPAIFLLLPITTLVLEACSTSWLLRACGDSLWINYRSCENDKLLTNHEQIV